MTLENPPDLQVDIIKNVPLLNPNTNPVISTKVHHEQGHANRAQH